MSQTKTGLVKIEEEQVWEIWLAGCFIGWDRDLERANFTLSNLQEIMTELAFLREKVRRYESMQLIA